MVDDVAETDTQTHAQADARARLVAEWLDLTRRVLPAMARAQRWPIHLDHCFMRVCLDAAYGRPWHEAIARPAIRHMDDDHLRRAIGVARAVRDDPARLPALDDASLRLRGHR